jgi:hypothetical protein
VDPEVATPVGYEPLERTLFLVRKDIAGGVDKCDGLEGR